MLWFIFPWCWWHLLPITLRPPSFYSLHVLSWFQLFCFFICCLSLSTLRQTIQFTRALLINSRTQNMDIKLCLYKERTPSTRAPSQPWSTQNMKANNGHGYHTHECLERDRFADTLNFPLNLIVCHSFSSSVLWRAGCRLSLANVYSLYSLQFVFF